MLKHEKKSFLVVFSATIVSRCPFGRVWLVFLHVDPTANAFPMIVFLFSLLERLFQRVAKIMGEGKRKCE